MPEQADSDASENASQAWVQAHCQLPVPGRPQVCCEQISISVSDAVAQSPGILLPLLVPDVPTVLWWPSGAPFNDSLFATLSALVDRVIVDSATFHPLERDIGQLITASKGRHAISDMAWGRLTPWRELIAQFFDAPALLPHVVDIEQVSIEYAAQPDAPNDHIPVLLMIGWLASRLGWQPRTNASQGDIEAMQFIRKDGELVGVEVRSVAAADPAHEGLVSLGLTCAHGRFSVQRNYDNRSAEAHAEVEGMTPLNRVVRVETFGEDEQLAEELRLLDHDRSYEAVLLALEGIRNV